MRIDKSFRKKMKRSARGNLRRHYVLFVLMCLFAAFIGSEFVTSDYLISARTDAIGTVASNYEDEIREAEQKGEQRVANIAGDSAFKNKTGVLIRDISHSEKTSSMFSRSAGTLNKVIDLFTEGTFLSFFSSLMINLAGSNSTVDVIFMILAALAAIAFSVFVQMIYSSVIRRISLEGRIYKKIPLSRFLFFFHTGNWVNGAMVLLLHALCNFAALLTVIAFPIVFYGLFFVPFILAENPGIKPGQAIKLSWRMTKGFKFALFVNDLTLAGWYVLGVITAGLTNIFYANPYRIAVYSEFYAAIRREAIYKRMDGNELLNDRFLFETCDLQRLKGAYPEVVNIMGTPEYELADLKGKGKFFADHFGVVLWNTPDEVKYEDNQASRQRILDMRNELEGLSYPTRLSPNKSRKTRNLFSLHYMRHYSVLSLIIMFFIYSGFGWVWEVFYYYILQGHYINRGVLHGPWLPIYGAGGLAILIFLFPIRKDPVKHFFATMILCGSIEYIASVVLEYVFDAKWWSYEGFFLNINGRICAEGLLVFGLAGFAFIYFLSPILDDRIRKIKPGKLLPVAVVLLILFVFDLFYSHTNPNMGDGITDGFAGMDNSVLVEKIAEEDFESAPELS